MQIKYNKISSRCNSALFCVLSRGLLSPGTRCLKLLVNAEDPKARGQSQHGPAEKLLGREDLKQGREVGPESSHERTLPLLDAAVASSHSLPCSEVPILSGSPGEKCCAGS